MRCRVAPEAVAAEMRAMHATFIRKAASAALVLLGIGSAFSPAGAQLAEPRVREMDNAIFWYARTEFDATQSPGPVVGSWDGLGWIGTDANRIWWRTFGERADGAFTEGELTLLYGRYVRMFWDLVAGVRYEFEPVGSGYFTAGIQGLAPYWFEIALLGFVSDRGKPGARFEIETDWFLTQRLIARPTARIDWFASDDAKRGIEAGFSTGEAGLRTRYEIRRKFAPYIDVRRVWEPGSDDAEGWRFGAGIWLVL